jgi:hypothetical protein
MPAARGLIWVVPGFGGSQLYAVDAYGNRRLLWLDVTSIVYGDAINSLVWGQPPPGTTVQPGQLLALLGYGYGGLLEAIAPLAAQGYTAMPWAYDFRDTALNLGAALATAIKQQGAGLDHKIFCHSYGTLVAQIAMGVLKSAGLDSLVSRVLAVGAIFSGSYSTAKTWREEEDSVNNLALAGPGGGIGSLGLTGLNPVPLYRQRLLQMFASLPATYDMLPDPSGADDPGDTLRSTVWNAAAWSGALAPPSAALMASSQAGFWATARSSGYAPDPSKWICVVGQDWRNPTPWRLAAPQPAPLAQISNPFFGGLGLSLPNPMDFNYASTLQRRASLPSIIGTFGGDNRSTFASQTRPGLPYLIVQGSHADLQDHPGVLRNLAFLLGIPGAQFTSGGQFQSGMNVALPVWPQS